MSKSGVRVTLKNGLGPALKRKPAELIRPNELSEICSHFKHQGELFYVVKWNTGEWPTMQTEEDLKDFEMDKVYYWEDWVALEPKRQARIKAQETREMMKSLGKEPFESPAVSSTCAAAVAPATKIIAKKSKIAHHDQDTDVDSDSTESGDTQDDHQEDIELSEVSDEEIDYDSEESESDEDDEKLRQILIERKRKRTQMQNPAKNSTTVAKKLDFKDVTDYRTKNIIIAKRKNLKRL